MTSYEELRERHQARLYEVLPELFDRLTWPRQRLDAARDAGVREIVAHAQAHSTWHRERLRAVDPAALRAADLSALPVMTKDDLMREFDAIVTDPRLTRDVAEGHLDALAQDAYLLDAYHVCASGGSSGRRGVFVYDFDAWALTFGSFFRFQMRRVQEVCGAELPAMAMVAADKASHMTSAFGQTFPPPAGVLQRLSATWPIARIVAELNALQPGVLFGYASLIHQLAGEAGAGRLRIAPKLVATTSEPLLPEIRDAVAAAWPVPLFNGFGSTEGLMGGSCSAGRGIHLSDDLFVIEPVDAHGAPAAPGSRAAKVYLTSLCNRVQPLIRYELTDEMTVLDEPCSCGMALLRIDDLEGRLDDSFVYPGGVTVHPFVYRSVLGRERAISEYQVRQTPAGADVLACAEDAVDVAGLTAALSEALRGAGLAQPVITVTIVDALDRQATGKLRRFVSLPGGG